MNKSKEHIEKIKHTNLEKYGVTTHLNSLSQKEKTKTKNIEKYGVEHNFQSIECKEKKELTFLEKYGFKHFTQSDVFKEKMYIKSIETLKQRLAIFNIELLDTNNFKGLANVIYTQSKINRFENRNYFNLKCMVFDILPIDKSRGF